jgi:GxxExxY protein
MEPIPKRTDEIARLIVDCAFHVHKALGPGLLESAYEACLCHEISKRNLIFRSQVALPILYNDLHLDAGYRIDILVEEIVIVELKSVETVLPLHHAQLMTYLKLSRLRLGILINFNVLLIKDGIKRIAL